MLQQNDTMRDRLMQIDRLIIEMNSGHSIKQFGFVLIPIYAKLSRIEFER